LEQAVADRPPFPFPQTPAEEQTQNVADQKRTSACAGHGGAILRHMSTADVARDLDRLRQLVGDKKLNYLGYSYGSVLGQTYANLFPHNVRAVVIDGVVDPIAWSTGRGTEATRLPFSTRLRSDVGARRTLNEFFRLCDAAGSDCAFSGKSARRYAALAERLKRAPVQIVDPQTGEKFELTYNILIAFSLGTLYQAAAWPDAATLLADVDAQVSAAQLGRDVAALRRALGLKGTAQEPYPNFVEGSPGVACSDSLNPNRFSAWQQAADTSEQRHGYFGRIWTWTWSPCLSWPTTALDDRYLGPWTARTSKPVLVVGNYFDPATRYRGAVVASRLLPNSRLLSYAGWGHAAFFLVANYCVDSKVTHYLLTTRTPKAGTTCKPEGSPFGPLTAASTSATSIAKQEARAAATATLLPPALRQVLRLNG
jgi:pimeloyl-ACP methyl ester carboxylesterase